MWKIIYLLIPIILIAEENIALNKKVVGTFLNPEKGIDGIIEPKNYTEATALEYSQMLAVCLNEAYYIDKIIIYWVDEIVGDRIVEISSDFSIWDKPKKLPPKIEEIKKGIIKETIEFTKEAAFFVRVLIPVGTVKKAKISEIEVYPDKKIKAKALDFRVIKKDEYSATFQFTSDYESMISIRVGETPKSLKEMGINLNYSKSHEIVVKNLLKGTKYYAEILARDCNGNTFSSKLIEFKTKGIPLPLFEKIQPIKITKTSALIEYESNVETKFELNYGLTKDVNLKISSKKLKKINQIRFSELLPDTTIYYKIKAIDMFGNIKISDLNKVTTLEDNIALNKKVRGSFLYTGENLAPIFNTNANMKITDGDIEYFTGSCLSSIPDYSEQYAIIDLEKEYKIDKVVCLWWKLIYSKNYQIRFSTDNSNWAIIRTGIDPEKEGILKSTPLGNPVIETPTLCNGKIARYIKLYIPQGTDYYKEFPQYFNLRLMELKVFPVKEKALPDKIVATIIQ